MALHILKYKQMTRSARLNSTRKSLDGNSRNAPGLPVEYWRITTSGPRGGLLKRPARAPWPGQGTNAFVCSMQVDDFDKIAKNVLDHGGAVALPKFAVPKICWQGYFLDTEGNTFGIFQLDASAA